MRPAKIVAIVFGVLLIIIGLAVLVPGGILLWLDGTADSEGYINTSTHTLDSGGHALVTPDVKLELGSGDWIPGDWAVQIQAKSTGDAPLFVGVGPTQAVMDYLSSTSYDTVTNIGWFHSGRTEYEPSGGGGAPPAPPGQQTFWVDKQEGVGTQTVQWRIQSGNWTAVVMNADGSAPVSAQVRLGAHLGFLLPLGIGMTVGGVVLLAVGILLVVLGAMKSRKPVQAAPGYPTGPPPGAPYGQPPYGQPYAQQPYGQAQGPPQTPYVPPPVETPAAAPPAASPEAAPPAPSDQPDQSATAETAPPASEEPREEQT